MRGPRLYIPAQSAVEVGRSSRQNERFHASRYSQGLLQLDRPRRHGRGPGPDRHQLRHLGHRRHLPRLRHLDRRQGRRHRNPRRHVPPALPGPAAAARPPVEPPDPAGPGAGARPRPAGARRGDRGNRARRAGPGARGSTSATPRSRAQITDDPSFKGITGQFDRARFESRAAQHRLHRSAASVPSSGAIALRQQLLGTVSGEPPVPKTALEAFNRFQNEERTHRLRRRSARRRPARSPIRRPRCSPSISRSARSCSARRSTARSRIVVLTPDDLADPDRGLRRRPEEGL